MLNHINPIEQIFVREDNTFYKELKTIIKQAELVSIEIFSKNNQEFNGIQLLQCTISEFNVAVNSNIIDFSNNDKSYEIQRQKIVENEDDEIKVKHKIINLTYEHEQLATVIEKQFLNWWEKKVKKIIHSKYGGLDNANNLCQFARQLRNSFGHSKINITINIQNQPIWKNINLIDYNSRNIFEVVSFADIINFWIEFERIELGVEI
ncbi:hypothetical protein [Flavobacterium polysaccharolyticum]|uniref:pEK499-p136 HEPN domain-containing protein n=1 Tax=Flavobacterium polysaccharolyticum TaxID=3133148 RepID=A0ABU9NTB2_9FLAO